MQIRERLTSEKRYAIQLCLRYGETNQTRIARLINVNKSTVCRELRRNRDDAGFYNYKLAQQKTKQRERKKHKERIDVQTWYKVFLMLQHRWSPEQISGVLRKEGTHISHETIYKYIRADKKHGGTLYKYCRFSLKHRCRTIAEAGAKHIPNRRDISERPPHHEPPFWGNWEMDLIVGAKQKGTILTLAERTTQYIIAVKLPYGRNAHEVAKAVVKALDIFKPLSITTDNGVEFADHAYITRKLHCPVYFAQPYKSWQKGSIEKANQLLRQYLPKRQPLDSITQDDLQRIMYELNSRPRKNLFYETPKNVCLYIINEYFCR